MMSVPFNRKREALLPKQATAGEGNGAKVTFYSDPR
jgi:hypothetical protein